MTNELAIAMGEILVFIQFMLDQAPELFGMRRPQEARPTLLRHDIDLAKEDDPDMLLLACRSFLQRQFWTIMNYKPRGGVSSGMWVKHRSRAWFEDFLLQYDDERWLQIMKMSAGTFDWLCNALAPVIQMQDTRYRRSLPVPMRVGAVLYKLLWAATTIEITEAFGIGRSTLYELLRQVVPAIISVLGHHLQWQGGETLKKSMLENEKRSGIPNVVGAIDCTQIRIKAPNNDIKFDYRNRNGYYSMVLQGVVDPDAKFVDIYVGEPGSMNDSRVLRNSPLFYPASQGTLLRGENVILDNGHEIPPLLIGDAVYPALPWLIPSYKRAPNAPVLSRAKTIFNHQLSKARIFSEIAFGQMKGTFKEVGWRSKLDIDFLPQVIHACCILYNLLVDFKEFDFEGIYNEMDAMAAIMERDRVAHSQEPVVNRGHTVGADLRAILCNHVINT